jgi:hypothetical protein
MRTPRAPGLDERRESDFKAELLARARLWIPDWNAADGEPDFAQALLAIAARLDAEVAERLDQAGDKMARGFLDWLAIQGQASIPARMPVVFKLADGAPAVSAPAPVKLQVDGLVFETETEVRLLPGRLEMIVGVDTAADAYYLPPPGLASLDPLDPLPTAWRLTSFAAPGSSTLQLDPAIGLASDMLLEIDGQQFRILEVKQDLVSIDPPVPPGPGFDPDRTAVTKMSVFTPFGGGARNRQLHAVYLGHPELLNIESAATIMIEGAAAMGNDTAWHYWGKRNGDETLGWQAFLPSSTGAMLVKAKGKIETTKVGEVESRWIRASMAKVAAPQFPLQTEALRLIVNPLGVAGKCDQPADSASGVDDMEAMANSTPLELNNIFFPLGREPRQFDSFYLGSAEAFSKRGATVRLCIDMADSSFASLASVRTGPHADRALAGVAKDGHLHLLQLTPDSGEERLLAYPNRAPLRPPSPVPGGADGAGPPVALDAQPPYRPAMWSRTYSPPGLTFQDMFVAVAARGAVWLWQEIGLLKPLSGWVALGTLMDGANPTKLIEGLVFLEDGTANGQLFALQDHQLFARAPVNTNQPWLPVPAKIPGGANVKLTRIVPIVDQLVDLGAGSVARGMLGVDDGGVLYWVKLTSVSGGFAASCEELFNHVASGVAPAGVCDAAGFVLAIAVRETAGAQTLHGWSSEAGVPDQHVPLEGTVIGHSIDVHLNDGELVVALSIRSGDGATGLGWWSPFRGGATRPLFTTPVPQTSPAATGAPTLLAHHLVLPASNQVLLAQFDRSGPRTFHTRLKSAVVTPLSETPLAANDHIAVKVIASQIFELRKIAATGVSRGGETLYELTASLSATAHSTDILVYTSSASIDFAALATLTTLELEPAAEAPGIDSLLLIETDQSIAQYKVKQVSAGTPRVVTLFTALDVVDVSAPPGTVHYWLPRTGSGRVAPLMVLNPATSGNWDAALLDRTHLTFPGAAPERQRGKPFDVDGNGHPRLVALDAQWTTAPPSDWMGSQFVLDGSIDNWRSQLGDAATNLELSWEYWNGASWWKLTGLRDETLNLKRSGAVRFDLPADIQPTDWSGKTNYWIRARLIGGDYGQPRTVVTTKNLGGGKTEQHIARFADELNAPQVLRLRAAYAASKPALPLHVITADNGALRDQSDANRTLGALVTIFSPLSHALSAGAGQPPADGAAGAAACSCSAGTAVAATQGQASSAPPARALYLGFSAELVGQPVNLLAVIARERAHEAFFPLRVEALCGDRYVPLVVQDTTRALGETGLLSMSLTVPAVTAGLFGRALSWLRLSPSHQDGPDSWEPSLRGLYINAAWARAAESMTRERLGSSIGAPHQVLYLARPPVLHATLELRVREALSGEERAALLAADPHGVVSDVADDLQGHWVLWRQVIDVADSGPLERVYALDETSGAVRFGDGMHGAIPPLGPDAIVAFAYQRSEPGAPGGVVPANRIAARSVLNLVTPVEGVEAAFAADQSAGGAPPDSPERVLRFAPAQLRHRGRAVTLRDFEALALQSSPDIVQARAFADGGAIRLVVAMRGEQVQPSQAARRALRRTLLAAAPVTLALQQALRVAGPRVRRLRIALALRIATLDTSGALAAYVQRSLSAYFDPASGGIYGDGWPLGAEPVPDDVALALLDAPHLEGIGGIDFCEIDDAGRATAWRSPVRPDQLVMLAADGLRITFAIVETES